VFTKHGHKSLSGSHFISFITLITFIVGLLPTPRTAEASRKITNTISVRVLIQGKQNNDNEDKESYFCDAGPMRAVSRVYLPVGKSQACSLPALMSFASLITSPNLMARV